MNMYAIVRQVSHTRFSHTRRSKELKRADLHWLTVLARDCGPLLSTKLCLSMRVPTARFFTAVAVHLVELAKLRLVERSFLKITFPVCEFTGIVVATSSKPRLADARFAEHRLCA